MTRIHRSFAALLLTLFLATAALADVTVYINNSEKAQGYVPCSRYRPPDEREQSDCTQTVPENHWSKKSTG